jgi:putative SOS response-associated peptidase YedK
MCGRFALGAEPRELAELLEVHESALPAELAPRYNIAPTQRVLVARRARADAVEQFGLPAAASATRGPNFAQFGLSAAASSTRGPNFAQFGSRQLELTLVRWGLIPSWAKDPAIGNRMINARAESVAEKPAFRAAFRRRRCLVLADGFYEWQKRGRGPKQPYLIRLRSGRPFAFAGLWESWRAPEGELVESCTLLTTTPNSLVERIHDRMPVLLHRRDHARWLTEGEDPAKLAELLAPFPAEEMAAHPVGLHVNNPRLDGPECVVPVPELFE